jgi:hypothetical protein
MWEPQHLTTLWASTACYMDSFTFYIKAYSSVNASSCHGYYKTYEVYARIDVTIQIPFFTEHVMGNKLVWIRTRARSSKLTIFLGLPLEKKDLCLYQFLIHLALWGKLWVRQHHSYSVLRLCLSVSAPISWCLQTVLQCKIDPCPPQFLCL